MKIDTTSIREGHHVGRLVWICDYRQEDIDKKPGRAVEPVQVVVRADSDLPKNKTLYYSNCFFSPLSKSGEPLKKVISPVDNTGHRSNFGNELHVFDNESECVDFFKKMVGLVVGKMRNRRDGAIQEWNEKIDKLLNKGL